MHVHVHVSIALQDSEKACSLLCSMLRALVAVVTGSSELRESLEVTVGYTHISDLISDLCTPNMEILQEALNMVHAVEGEREGGTVYTCAYIIVTWAM